MLVNDDVIDMINTLFPNWNIQFQLIIFISIQIQIIKSLVSQVIHID